MFKLEDDFGLPDSLDSAELFHVAISGGHRYLRTRSDERWDHEQWRSFPYVWSMTANPDNYAFRVDFPTPCSRSALHRARPPVQARFAEDLGLREHFVIPDLLYRMGDTIALAFLRKDQTLNPRVLHRHNPRFNPYGWWRPVPHGPFDLDRAVTLELPKERCDEATFPQHLRGVRHYMWVFSDITKIVANYR